MRTSTRLFNFMFTKDNIAGLAAGPRSAALDRWFAYIKPLPPDNHTIRFGGVAVTARTGSANFAVDATCHLTIG